MRTLTEFNRGRVGLMGVVVTMLAVGVGQSFTSVPMLFATPTYYAQFTDTGGISTGDKVEIAGVEVGLVRSLAIRGNKVAHRILVTRQDDRDGQSRVAIRTDTILGRKNMQIEPRGCTTIAAQRFSALGADHDALPGLRCVRRCHEGGGGLGRRGHQTVAEGVVGNLRSDGPASECRPQRCQGLLRHHRSSGATSSSNCWRTPTRSLACSATAAVRSTGCWSTPTPCWPRSSNAARR